MKHSDRRGFLMGCAGMAALASPVLAIHNAPVRVACFPTSSSAVAIHALRAGLFAAEGLRVELEIVPAATAPRDLFESGSFDIVSGLHLFLGAPLAADPVSLARFFIFHGYNEEHVFDTLVAPRDRGIHSVADLAGRHVLIVEGQSNRVVIDDLLERAGIRNRDAVRLTALPQSEFAGLLRDRQADAAFSLEPWASSLEHFHDFPIVERGLLSRYIFGGPDIVAYFGGVMARTEFMQRRLPELRRLALAWTEAFDAVWTNRDARQAAFAWLYPSIQIAPSVGLPKTILASRMDGADLQQLQMSLHLGSRLRMIQRNVDVTSIYVAV